MDRIAYPAIGLALSLLIATAAGAQPTPNAKFSNPETQRVLEGMRGASTWGHPDLFGEFAGMSHFANGDYKGAMKYFRIGARYADKLSQLSIGLMYANGTGVDKDPVTACAWLALAAERKYPSFIATRDRVCKPLTPAQHDKAVAVLDGLMPEFGDQVAKKRLAVEMQLTNMQMTGSRLGFNSGVSQYVGRESTGPDAPATPSFRVSNCGNPTLYLDGVPVPKAGCGGSQFYSATLRDPDKYFATRDAYWHGSVTVGSLQHTDAASSNVAEPASASSVHNH